MDDIRIVELYWNRSEEAITRTASKYGKYLYSISYNILNNKEDAEESVNDTYTKAWYSMPPQRPTFLNTFLGKITRNISIDKWRKANTNKRGGGEIPLVLEELEECIADKAKVEQAVELKQLAEAINNYVKALPPAEQQVFVCRYWYMDSIDTICKQFHFSESKVKSMLYRTREKLRTELEKEGFV